MTGRVTINDVAKLAGVSSQTVSRVINNKGEVSSATRENILNIIDEIGYRPSGIARSLATARTSTIGLVVPDIANPFFSDVARGVEQAAYTAGYKVFLCNTDEEPERELIILHGLEEARVDGIVACGLRHESDALRSALTQFPAATAVNLRIDDTINRVLVDDVFGGRVITQHLLDGGHTAIGFVAGPERSFSGKGRWQGYREALEHAGIEPEATWVRYCRPMVDDGEIATRELLAGHSELTALFCYNDLIAVGALRACESLRLRVPDDVAIVGYDDIDLAALVTPPLTTCRQPRERMGAVAFELLLEQLNGNSNEGKEIVIRPELVIRASAP